MPLTHLLIKDFRNISYSKLNLAQGFNFIVGENGSGKTSFLEAIYTLGHGKAFRSPHTKNIVNYGKTTFFLSGNIRDQGRSINTRKRRRAQDGCGL